MFSVNAEVGSVRTTLEFVVDGEKKEAVSVRTWVWRALKRSLKFESVKIIER